MKRNWLLYLVMFSLALNLGTIGTLVYMRYQGKAPELAQQGPPPPLAMRALWRELNLDESQRQAVRRLFPVHHARVTEMRGELFQERQQLFDLLKAESPDQKAIRAKVQEISALQGKLEEELVDHVLEFRKHLKPEQNAAFLKLVQTRLDKALGPFPPGRRGGHRRGPGGMGPPPMEPPPGMGPDRCPAPGQGLGPGGPGCPE